MVIRAFQQIDFPFYEVPCAFPETFLTVVADNMSRQLDAEKMTEEKVVGWVESRYEETRRNRSKRKLLAPEQLPNAEE